MRRREFMAGLGGTAAWPLVARAQQGEPMRRIGVLNGGDEDDPFVDSAVSAFMRGLTELNWINGRNLRIDLRYARRSVDQARISAKELVGLRPEVILAGTTVAAAALQHRRKPV
jgi:putative tryptophan/tyrosine transport system substrate-binding protein